MKGTGAWRKWESAEEMGKKERQMGEKTHHESSKTISDRVKCLKPVLFKP